MADILLYLLFTVIAFIYSGAGFGGGSSYLAIFSLYAISHNLPFQEVKLVSLICNIVVVGGSILLYFKNRLIDYKKQIPLVVLSIPMAFLGAQLQLKEHVFYILLGITLLIAAVFIWLSTILSQDNTIKASQWYVNTIIGGFVGFVSGLVGIGGGIFLSPILHLSKWDTSKKIASTATLFILVNSISGLLAQTAKLTTTPDWNRILILALAVATGGQVGARLTIKVFSNKTVKRLTAGLVFFAGLEVLYKTLVL